MPLAPRARRALAIIAASALAASSVAGVYFASATRLPSQGPASSGPPGGDGLREGRAGVRVVRVGGGFAQPTDVQFTPTKPGYLIVLEKAGTAQITPFDRDAAERAPVRPARTLFRVDVRAESEMGLLGLAFHPGFARNGRFFVHYNPAGPKLRSRIAEWHVDPAELAGAPASEVRTLLEIEQPYGNHKGGQLAFGPDGKLYVGFGDGGASGDPHGNAQRLDTLLGKVLRIDVDGQPYAVPSDNPHVGRAGARPEIWAHGLRNPWRFSFDGRGRLIVADVGQDLWEEVDIVGRGDNLGWNAREGRHCDGKPACATEGLIEPVWEYGHDVGASITGGYVYEGSRAPSLRGKWLCGDFVSRRLWALALPEDTRGEAAVTPIGQSDLMVSTFGRAPDGEVYAIDFMTGNLYGFAAAVSP